MSFSVKTVKTQALLRRLVNSFLHFLGGSQEVSFNSFNSFERSPRRPLFNSFDSFERSSGGLF